MSIAVADLILVRSMPRSYPDRPNPWVLLAMAGALMGAGFFFYTDHPVRDSNLYSPHAPGWFALVIFVVIGMLSEIIRMRDRKRNGGRAKRNAGRET